MLPGFICKYLIGIRHAAVISRSTQAQVFMKHVLIDGEGRVLSVSTVLPITGL